MKQEYIQQVGRALPLPGKQKREVLRDLEELFASAREHGESEAQVLDRLGSPEEYAKEVLAQTGYVPKPGESRPGAGPLRPGVRGVFGPVPLEPERPPAGERHRRGGEQHEYPGGGRVDLSPLLLVEP